jgi:hypothetical protein
MEIKEIQQANTPKPLIIKGVFIVAIFLLIVFGIWNFSSGIREDMSNRSATSTLEKLSAKKKSKTPTVLESSYYNNWVKFVPSTHTKETYPGKEYVEIEVVQANLSNADATGWVLKNSQDESATLGQASPLPLSGKVNTVEPLKIKAGDHLFISTGRSPIGVSFRVNKCSGYLEQFQDFIPPISEECPSVTFGKNTGTLDNNCQSFLSSIRPCETNARQLPGGVLASCKAFLDSTVNYNGCVANHKNDADFYLKEWRIFLGKEKELWAQEKETVTLLDEKGGLVDVFKY